MNWPKLYNKTLKKVLHELYFMPITAQTHFHFFSMIFRWDFFLEWKQTGIEMEKCSCVFFSKVNPIWNVGKSSYSSWWVSFCPVSKPWQQWISWWMKIRNGNDIHQLILQTTHNFKSPLRIINRKNPTQRTMLKSM